MRVMKLAISGMLAACVVFPAAAAKAAVSPKTWEQCHIEALRHGLIHGHAGNAEFMKECLGGHTTGSARAAAPVVGTFAQCEQRALQLGMPHGQAGHTEYVRECMGGRPKGRTPT